MLDWTTLNPDDLPGDLGEIARAHGMATARYFLEEWGGMQIWIHSIRELRAWDRLTPEMLPGDLAEIAGRLGMDVARDIAERWGGLNIYIPVYTAIIKPRLVREFTGRNAGALARRYGVPRRLVLRTVARGMPPAPAPKSDEQLRLL